MVDAVSFDQCQIAARDAMGDIPFFGYAIGPNNDYSFTISCTHFELAEGIARIIRATPEIKPLIALIYWHIEAET